MSSMFKKRGGPAFKPKVPSARARPAAPALAKAAAAQVAAEKIDAEDEIRDSVETFQAATSGQSTPRETSTATESRDQATKSTTTDRPRVAQQHTPDPLRPQDTASSSTQKATVEIAASIDRAGTEEATVAHNAPPTLAPDSTPMEAPARVSSRLSHSISRPAAGPTSENHAQDIDGVNNAPEQEPEQDELPAVADLATVKPTPKPRPRPRAPVRPKGSKATVAVEDPTTASTAEDAPAARPAKRPRATPRRPSDAAAAVDQDGATGEEESESAVQDESESAPKRPRKRAAPKNPRKPRQRSATPEDAEEQTVDLQNLKMADLTQDLRIGKKFSRHDELRERERQAKLRRKRGESVADDESAAKNSPGPSNEGASPAAAAGTPAATAAAANGEPSQAPAAGPQFRIVDGQIVVDQSSLVMDRHARAAANAEDMEAIEENDFTRLITSNSFMNTSKLKGPNIWTAEETELFYRALGMFGTDFEMISKMFPGKQRRHVKLKFNREERHNPSLIDSALIGEKSVKMDIDEYKTMTSTEFESIESIEAEHKKAEEEFEAERQRVLDEQAEVMRKKREQLFADDDGNPAGEGENAELHGKKKKKKKSKKQQAEEAGLYGEEEIIE
ncbi:transcription factor tfiiib component [Emericellopsis cladophorae]|uniref:Transcription factor tfiiib component n=1 Tax=Emericellopsis cladophorae TaxID=2686198 RepID=A0A9Q0BFE5_9HYPO|nr:transcription factor tfiiib component [Emericellopsis cladophorae]KAI6782209.1 transcription factor tfiiib component [Emericellopsis cladophorae]